MHVRSSLKCFKNGLKGKSCIKAAGCWGGGVTLIAPNFVHDLSDDDKHKPFFKVGLGAINSTVVRRQGFSVTLRGKGGGTGTSQKSCQFRMRYRCLFVLAKAGASRSHVIYLCR